MARLEESRAKGVRVDFIPGEHYTSRAFVERENRLLWPNVWQMACREEEIPEPGDFYTYNVASESVTVVRTREGGIAAYHNVCPHRGRRLTSGCGHMARFHCKYHGWQWNLDGSSAAVVDRHDWDDLLQDEDITLHDVRVGSWGGWVFVNMAREGETLEQFLATATPLLDPYHLENQRYRWRRETVIPCNWKVALEAFNEAYHVQTTHRQLLPGFDDVTYSRAYGRHGMFGYAPGVVGRPSPRLRADEATSDPRRSMYYFFTEIWQSLDANLTEEMNRAAERLLELPEGSDLMTCYGAFAQYHREEVEKAGRPWPEISVEAMMAGGADWHIFPNLVFLQQATNLLGYRARPNGDDPDSCIFEVFALELYAPGQEPKVEVGTAAWDSPDWCLILQQDFQNMGEIQKGMKSRAFKGARPNPVQERAVSNFHESLREFLDDQEASS